MESPHDVERLIAVPRDRKFRSGICANGGVPCQRRRAFLCLVFIALATALIHGRYGGCGSVPGVWLAQLADTSEQRYYANTRTLLDLPLPQLLKALPELRGLEPAANQEQLPLILREVGKGVEESYQDLPNVVAKEEVTQEQLEGINGRVKQTFHRGFSYLVLAHNESGRETVTEYRVDAQGERIEPQGLVPGMSITEGFACMWALFFPGNQSESNFRYLGRQSLSGRETQVVAFAQRPGWSVVTGRSGWKGKSVVLLYQGLAWIDTANNRIIRMRLDLLAPRLDVKLEELTSQIEYAETRLAGTDTVLWLPLKVTVTTVANGEVFRNLHLYSNYKRFVVNSTIKPVE